MLADARTHSMNAAIKPARIQTDTAIVLQIVGDHRKPLRPALTAACAHAGPPRGPTPGISVSFRFSRTPALVGTFPRPHLCHTWDSAKRASSAAYGACMSGTRQWAAHYGGCEESGPAPASVVGVLYSHCSRVALPSTYPSAQGGSERTQPRLAVAPPLVVRGEACCCLGKHRILGLHLRLGHKLAGRRHRPRRLRGPLALPAVNEAVEFLRGIMRVHQPPIAFVRRDCVRCVLGGLLPVEASPRRCTLPGERLRAVRVQLRDTQFSLAARLTIHQHATIAVSTLSQAACLSCRRLRARGTRIPLWNGQPGGG